MPASNTCVFCMLFIAGFRSGGMLCRREPEDEVLRMLSHFLHHHMHEYVAGAPS